jgi:hypothetical protein
MSILADRPGLVCTSGTGILPLCANVTATWRQLEQNPAGMSAMAAASVRALGNTMITCVLAAAGGNRWCEIASAPAAAGPFAAMFPEARFICFHRACPDVISAATQAARWGLGSAGIGDFAATYPGNSVAAVAAYWCARTRAMLDFEADHPGRTLRVRHEDLTATTAATTTSIVRFTGLTEHEPALPDLSAQAMDGTADEPRIPVELLPAPLLDRINDLHAALGYPALARDRQLVESSRIEDR